MAAPAYLLDTSIVLHLVRDSAVAHAIEQQFALAAQRTRPLICEVSVGEMLAFSRSLGWGPQKQARLKDIVEKETVIVRIGDPLHGKNDLWVGAAAQAARAHLLTTDTDFLPLRGREGGKDGW
ncbi:MAG: hypothetical protein AB7P99_02535 [Vicinamibacterales bacterium]